MGAVSKPSPHSARSQRRRDPHQRAGRAKILVRDGRARGVVLESGEEIDAQIVASQSRSASSRSCKLMDERDLPTGFRGGDPQFPHRRHVAARSIWRSTACPNFARYPGAPGPQHRATMHICPCIEYVERAWDDAKYGRPSRSPAARDDHSHHVRSVARARRASTSWASFCNTRPTRCARAPGTNCASPSPTA